MVFSLVDRRSLIGFIGAFSTASTERAISKPWRDALSTLSPTTPEAGLLSAPQPIEKRAMLPG